MYSFRGATTTQFLEWLTPSSLSTLAPYSSTLSVLLNENGGIIDDTVITKHASDAFYVVTNAGRRAEDLAWFEARLAEWNASERAKDGPVEHEVLEGWGLLALQGMSNVPGFQGSLMEPNRSGSGGPPAGPDVIRSARLDVRKERVCSTRGPQRARRPRWVHR
jgi:Aminomethyltransferase folate-binding domain